jgi:hypothetical protein
MVTQPNLALPSIQAATVNNRSDRGRQIAIVSSPVGEAGKRIYS